MYFYYLCAAFGPEVQKYLWWKKYITTIQLVQFVLVFVHAIQPLFFECNFPRAASLMFAGIPAVKNVTQRNTNIFRNGSSIFHPVLDVLQENLQY